MVEDYKNVGVYTDSILKWKINTKAIYKERMSRLYFPRKMRSFNMCSRRWKYFTSAMYVVC